MEITSLFAKNGAPRYISSNSCTCFLRVHKFGNVIFSKKIVKNFDNKILPIVGFDLVNFGLSVHDYTILAFRRVTKMPLPIWKTVKIIAILLYTGKNP